MGVASGDVVSGVKGRSVPPDLLAAFHKWRPTACALSKQCRVHPGHRSRVSAPALFSGPPASLSSRATAPARPDKNRAGGEEKEECRDKPDETCGRQNWPRPLRQCSERKRLREAEQMNEAVQDEHDGECQSHTCSTYAAGAMTARPAISPLFNRRHTSLMS